MATRTGYSTPFWVPSEPQIIRLKLLIQLEEPQNMRIESEIWQSRCVWSCFCANVFTDGMFALQLSPQHPSNFPTYQSHRDHPRHSLQSPGAFSKPRRRSMPGLQCGINIYIYNIEGSKGVDYIHAFLVHRFLQVFRTHFLWINMFKAFSITQVVSSYEHWSCFDCCCQTKKVVRIPTINDEVSNITFFGFAMHTHCRTFPVDV